MWPSIVMNTMNLNIKKIILSLLLISLVYYLVITFYVISDSHNENNLSFINMETMSLLERRTKVFCFILTSIKNMKTRAIYQKDTWLKRCDNYLFGSAVEDLSLPAINACSHDIHDSAMCKFKNTIKYIWNKYGEEYDWYFKTDDDSYIVVENLRALISPLNPNDYIFYGFKFVEHLDRKIEVLHGGSGFLMSRSSVKLLIEYGLDDSKYCNQNEYIHDDITVSDCFYRLGANVTGIIDNLKRFVFCPYDPERMLYSNFVFPFMVEEIPFKDTITTGINSVGDFPIAFHYVGREMMYLLEYLFYHSNVVGKKSRINKLFNNDSIGDYRSIAKKYNLIKAFSRQYFSL
uniref:N-acetylgalactosaminide beta-1,3-galactosyltransferase n=1 Tax=Parastrongyloides trichosuri TaxID=131310 RepID=A0A0N4ZDU4_PARTI